MHAHESVVCEIASGLIGLARTRCLAALPASYNCVWDDLFMPRAHAYVAYITYSCLVRRTWLTFEVIRESLTYSCLIRHKSVTYQVTCSSLIRSLYVIQRIRASFRACLIRYFQ